jgi:hypothetical protein
MVDGLAMTKRAKLDVMTPRDLETLIELEAANRSHVEKGFRNGWARPMDCGGHDGSHHSKTLQKLARMGFVDTDRTPGRPAGFPNSRPSIGYKINAAGELYLANFRITRRKTA